MNDLKDKILKLSYLSIPMIGNAILSQMINLITMLYVGRIDGALYMGAATLGNMLLVFYLFLSLSSLSSLSSLLFSSLSFFLSLCFNHILILNFILFYLILNLLSFSLFIRCNISGYSLAYGMCCALDVRKRIRIISLLILFFN